ncbi:MAG: putative metal-dependent hydrolase [Saprospiraceae bacterium]|nr:putative metal-dependent hydrolase [Saprospiraceae bacterium]
MNIENLKYPIGKYNPGEIKMDVIKEWIEELRTFPSGLEEVLSQVDHDSLLYTYRPGGWNIQQLVHHLADSHMNSLIRFKLALTEDNPIIKPYLEAQWSEMYDVHHVSIESSIKILKGVHARLSSLLSNMSILDFAKTYTHPEHGKSLDLAFTVGMYAWHGNHHLEHIKAANQFQKIKWD